MIKALGCNYLGIERRQFETDRGNDKVLRFLLYYFNDCPLAESVFPEENYKLHKNLLIVGDPGTGKTLMMQIFADYLKLTDNPNASVNYP